MGSSGSKAARSVAGGAARKYPSRLPNQAPPTSSATPASQRPTETPGPTVHPRPQASSIRSEAIDLDARDPDFADRLFKLGPVKPAPTFSPSSTTTSPPASTAPNQNHQAGKQRGAAYPSAAASPAMAIIAARQRIQDAAEQERIDAGRKGFLGKQYLDITMIKRALMMRDERGMNPSEIEEVLGLKKGTMAKLGQVGVVEVA